MEELAFWNIFRVYLTALFIFGLSILDQYNSFGINKSIIPLFWDPEKVRNISNAERIALMRSPEVNRNCPPPCTTVQYDGSVTRFQSGKWA